MSALAGGSSYPTAKFGIVGKSVAGTIIDFADVQERMFNSTTPKWWGEDGKPVGMEAPEANALGLKPVYQVRVTLEQEPGNTESRVSLYISGKRQMDAVREAYAPYGLSDLRAGDQLRVTFTGKDGNANTWSASYAVSDPNA
jgi:hypothetical protein